MKNFIHVLMNIRIKLNTIKLILKFFIKIEIYILWNIYINLKLPNLKL